MNSKICMYVLSMICIAATSTVVADEDGGLFSWFKGKVGKGSDVAAVTNEKYATECGACHFAYQPGLLPARSWKKIMSNLSDHYGENAELAKEDNRSLTAYLVENAADDSKYKRSKKIMASINSNETPLRITKTPYIVEKHNELTPQMVVSNQKVGSLSNCAACHTKAKEGSFQEEEILIPGFGRWED
ncbi:MAG: diheme cytochrome c [Gammaproteobacteria bacterium]|nr:diheme cytochrome c [Gammaproteobacteria bacterium]